MEVPPGKRDKTREKEREGEGGEKQEEKENEKKRDFQREQRRVDNRNYIHGVLIQTVAQMKIKDIRRARSSADPRSYFPDNEHAPTFRERERGRESAQRFFSFSSLRLSEFRPCEF